MSKKILKNCKEVLDALKKNKIVEDAEGSKYKLIDGVICCIYYKLDPNKFIVNADISNFVLLPTLSDDNLLPTISEDKE